MNIEYRKLNQLSASDVRELVDVLFSTDTVISNLCIGSDEIDFDVTCPTEEGIEMTDHIYAGNYKIGSDSLYMSDDDEQIYGQWLLAKGVDSRLINNPFIKEE